MRLRFAALLLLTGGLFQATPGEAQVAPDARWSSFDTPRFRVHFQDAELEGAARRAAAHAERAYDALAEVFVDPPRGRIELVVADNADLANGFAITVPANRIVVYTHPPVDQPTLAHFDDWLELVVVHELAHLFHLDQAGGIWRPLRRVFGRNVTLLPHHHTPGWLIEGLAVYFESRLTGAGRVRDSHHEMVLRTAVLEDAFFPIDRATGDPAAWPGSAARYTYGALFVAHLAERHGEAALGRFVRELGGQLVPYRLDAAARRAFGVGFTDAWRAWTVELQIRYGALADSVRAEGLTEVQLVSNEGGFAAHPRAGPDGRIAWASYTRRDEPATRILAADGRSAVLARRSSIGQTAWLPDGEALISAELEPRDPYRVYSELVRIDADGRRTRLTRGARFRDPDVHPLGARVVGVGHAPGTNALQVLELETGATRTLVPPSPEIHWTGPRWSPDGARIAAGRWRQGGFFDVVVVDTAGALVREVTASRAIDRDPAWSPDGRYLLFSSDRSGIANLYAYDLEAGALFRVTNVLTGAVQPDVSRDGEWIVFSLYGADGFQVARLPWRPEDWTPVELDRPAPRDPAASIGSSAAPVPEPDAVGASARAYRPGAGLLPTGWALEIDHGTALGPGVGAALGGRDAVARHLWTLDLRAHPAEALGGGRLNYQFRGLGQPVVELDAAQEWRVALEGWPAATPAGDTLRADLFHRERRATILLRQSWPRWRSNRWVGGGPDVRLGSYRWNRPEVRGELAIPDPPLDLGLRAFGGYSSVRGFAYSISPEQGVLAQVSAEARRFARPPTDADDTRAYQRLLGNAQAYQPLERGGFARHVAGLRLAAGVERGEAGPGFAVGGVSGSDLTVGGFGISAVHRTFAVRGYPVGAQRGDRALAGTLEYRFPLLLVERGVRTWPVFLDRVWGDVFLDAGAGWCARAACERPFHAAPRRPAPVAAAGAELLAATLFGYDTRYLLRGGLAVPLRAVPTADTPQPRPRPQIYLVGGRSF